MPQERVADSQTGWSKKALASGGPWEDLGGEEVVPGLGEGGGAVLRLLQGEVVDE